jgi:hypothetical protein
MLGSPPLMWRLIKGLVGLFGGVLFVYLFVVPIIAWEPPVARVNLPESWPKGHDLPLQITLTAQHANFDVASIRFYVDYHGSSAKGPEGLFYPAMIFEQRPRSIRGFWQQSWLTYPHTRTLDVTAPLQSFTEQGLLGPGTLTGKVDVNYVSIERRAGKQMPGVDRMRPGMTSVPFSMTITD